MFVSLSRVFGRFPINRQAGAGSWRNSCLYAVVIAFGIVFLGSFSSQALAAPAIVSATSSSTVNGYYKSGDVINITLTFNEAVSSTGLSLQLDSGAVVNTGVITSASSWSGDYTVAAGQTSPDLKISSVTGTITNASLVGTTNPAVPPGANISDSKNIVVDTTAPTVAIGSPSQSSTKTGPISYTVTYADTNLGIVSLPESAITLNATGTATGTVGVSGAGNVFTVTISGITGKGTLGIAIGPDTAADLAGNLAGSAGPSATFLVGVQLSISLAGTGFGSVTVKNGSTVVGSATYPAQTSLLLNPDENTTLSVCATPSASVTSSGSNATMAGGSCAGTFSCDTPCDIVMNDNKSVAVTLNSVVYFTETIPTLGGEAPVEIAFHDQSSNAPSSWTWAFGDGGSSSSQNPNHLFSSAGTYQVTLTTNDGQWFKKSIPLAACRYYPVWLEWTGTLSTSVMSVYNAAWNGDSILLHALRFIENLNFTNPIQVSLDGGFDCDYGTTAEFSSIKGTVTVSSGGVTFDNIVIE